MLKNDRVNGDDRTTQLLIIHFIWWQRPCCFVHWIYQFCLWSVKECNAILHEIMEGAQRYGFVWNPYNPCVANTIIKDAQMMVIKHVDNLKISHRNPEAMTQMIKYMEASNRSLTILHRCKHDYLGMNHDFSEETKVSTSIDKYTKQVIDAFLNDTSIVAAIPVSDHLLKWGMMMS